MHALIGIVVILGLIIAFLLTICRYLWTLYQSSSEAKNEAIQKLGEVKQEMSALHVELNRFKLKLNSYENRSSSGQAEE